MKSSVYIETTVISYMTARPSRDLIVSAHQHTTIDWWENNLGKFAPFISQVVIDEINRGDVNAAQKRLKATQNIPILEVTPEIEELAGIYLKAIHIPEESKPDAFHLAIAVWHGMDFIVSWNCIHIASGRVRRIIEEINLERSIRTPAICTPEELMEA